MLKLSKCSRAEFISAISTDKKDNFAKTFVSKADMQDQWKFCIGAYDNDELTAAIITSISKNKPHVANLQLLHTFVKHRGKGSARILCEDSLKRVRACGATYFRVSSEKSAVGFYEHLGFKFWGAQKSGTQLSIFRIVGDTFLDGEYDLSDIIIYKAVNRKGKGGCTILYDLAKAQNWNKINNFLCIFFTLLLL
jgi:GNAT superfamily N-acetyltransferase